MWRVWAWGEGEGVRVKGGNIIGRRDVVEGPGFGKLEISEDFSILRVETGKVRQ